MEFVQPAHAVWLLCSLPWLLSFVSHNGRGYLKGQWRGLAATTGVIHLPCISCWNLICCQERCQPKTSCGLNELLWGRQSALYLFLCCLFLSYGKGLDIYCAHSTVELYKSNAVRTQWNYCAFADWLLCAYLCRNAGSGTQTWEKVGCQPNSDLPLKSCSRRILLFNILNYNIKQIFFLPMTDCSWRLLLLSPTDLLHCRYLAVSSSLSII